MSRGKTLLYRVVVTIVILLGIGLLAYPSVSNWYNDMHRSRAIAVYENAIAGLSDVDFESMFEQARAYNDSLIGNARRFSPDDAELESYNQILDVTGTGIMGYIEIPKINVKLPIYHTVEETVLQIAAGHMPGTSFPIGEIGSHAVISGHRGLPSAKLFTHLDELDAGDLFQVHVLNKTMVYEIYEVEVVLPEDMDSLRISSDRNLITLVTCTPYGVNSHRILVHAEQTDKIISSDDDSNLNSNLDAENKQSDGGSDFDFNLRDDFGLVLIAVFVVLMLAFAVYNRHCKHSNHNNHTAGGQDSSE